MDQSGEAVVLALGGSARRVGPYFGRRARRVHSHFRSRSRPRDQAGETDVAAQRYRQRITHTDSDSRRRQSDRALARTGLDPEPLRPPDRSPVLPSGRRESPRHDGEYALGVGVLRRPPRRSRTHRMDVSRRVRSDAPQLENILRQRAEKAFEDDVLSNDVIPLTAAFSGQESGSARQALKLLYKAGDLVRSRDETMVVEEHVREAEPLVEAGKVEDELVSLPTQSHLTLHAVLRLSEEGELPVKSNVIYQQYQQAAEAIDADVKTDRTIRDRLSQLSLKGFLDVDERNKGSQGGSYYLYDLDIREELVRDVLESDDRMSPLYGSETRTLGSF